MSHQNGLRLLLVLYLTSFLVTTSSPTRLRREVEKLQVLEEEGEEIQEVDVGIEDKDSVLDKHDDLTEFLVLDDTFLGGSAESDTDGSGAGDALTESSNSSNESSPEAETILEPTATEPSTSTESVGEPPEERIFIISRNEEKLPAVEDNQVEEDDDPLEARSEETQEPDEPQPEPRSFDSAPPSENDKPEDLTIDEEEEAAAEAVEEDAAAGHCHPRDVSCQYSSFKSRSDSEVLDLENEERCVNDGLCDKSNIDRVMEINVPNDEDDVEAQSGSIFNLLRTIWSWF